MGLLGKMASFAVRAAVSSAAKGVAKEVLSSTTEPKQTGTTFTTAGIDAIDDEYADFHDGLRCKVTSLRRNGNTVIGEGVVRNNGSDRFCDVSVEVEYRFKNGNVIDSDYITVVDESEKLRPGESKSFRFSSNCGAGNVGAICLRISSYSSCY